MTDGEQIDQIEGTKEETDEDIEEDEEEEEEGEWRFLGIVQVDSGTLVVGDPTYLLPDRERGKSGLDYEVVTSADTEQHSVPLANDVALLIQNFGGDGPYPVFGEFYDDELMALRINFVPIGEEDWEDE